MLFVFRIKQEAPVPHKTLKTRAPFARGFSRKLPAPLCLRSRFFSRFLSGIGCSCWWFSLHVVWTQCAESNYQLNPIQLSGRAGTFISAAQPEGFCLSGVADSGFLAKRICKKEKSKRWPKRRITSAGVCIETYTSVQSGGCQIKSTTD